MNTTCIVKLYSDVGCWRTATSWEDNRHRRVVLLLEQVFNFPKIP